MSYQDEQDEQTAALIAMGCFPWFVIGALLLTALAWGLMELLR